MIKSYEVAAPNKLIQCPEPGILFTRANARLAYYALKDAREAGLSIPEQDELCDELAAILFPPALLCSGRAGCGAPDGDSHHSHYCPRHSLNAR
jgi:hypothetical protein